MDFNFNLKTTAIYQAVKWEKRLVFRFNRILKKIYLVLFSLCFLVFVFGFLAEAFREPVLFFALGFSIIFLVLSFTCQLKEAFLNSKLKKPKLRITIGQALSSLQEYNLAEFLSFEAAKAVFQSLKFAKRRSISKINSTILFYHLLVENPELNFIFSRVLLNAAEIKKTLEVYFKNFKLIEDESQASYSEDFQKSILEALKTAGGKEHARVEATDLLLALAKNDLIFGKILVDANLKIQDIENLTWWLEELLAREEERKRFWEWRNLIRKGTLAKEWTAGYTVVLDRFSIDLSELMKRSGFPETIGHQKEIEQIERILSRSETNNVLLVGEPGTGRKAIVQGLAAKSVLGQSLPGINYKRIVVLDVPSVLVQAQTQEEVQAILDRIFQEVVSAGNVILAISDFHNFVRTEKSPGMVDISGILSSYLSSPRFQLIANSSYQGLHKYIERRPAVLDLFEKVEVSEISQREALMFLEKLTLAKERKYKKFISYPALREIISLADRYLPALPFPKKAIGLLDEVMAYVSSFAKDKIVLPKHVARIVSEKTEIPVGEIEAKEKEVLLNLENLIHQRIINQEIAVKEVSTALRRARAEVTTRKGPMGTFLFLGPTGVGKTETSKALSAIYFGSEDRMIRLDMSEFQNVKDMSRLIGSAQEDGFLTTQVRERPFSLILLDEIEKAHKNILNLFLQVLDEGFLTDGLGRRVNFQNSIIIATSNAGYQIILKALREKTEWSLLKQLILDFLFEKAVFRPEFINRFDAVVVFKPLSKKNLLDISELMLQKLKKNLKEKNIEFVITQPLKEKIVELGYDPTFGARQMRRVIQDRVENALASALLSDQLKRGDKVEVEPENFELKITKS
ncbi:MAG: ATP-dependent Clp protease ATP-binding subunit [bacterium]